jgi:hypothetical protein
MAFLAIPFAMTAGRAALSFGARAIAPTIERTLMPVATSVAREVTREAGVVAAQVVGQSAVDQISSTVHSATSGPIGQAASAVVTQAGSTAVALVSGDVVGVVRGTVQQTVNQVHLAQAVYTGLTTADGETHVVVEAQVPTAVFPCRNNTPCKEQSTQRSHRHDDERRAYFSGRVPSHPRDEQKNGRFATRG